MNERKRQIKIQNEEIFDQFYDLNSVACATGFTGMTPSLPQSEDDLEAYCNIHGLPKKK